MKYLTHAVEALRRHLTPSRWMAPQAAETFALQSSQEEVSQTLHTREETSNSTDLPSEQRDCQASRAGAAADTGSWDLWMAARREEASVSRTVHAGAMSEGRGRSASPGGGGGWNGAAAATTAPSTRWSAFSTCSRVPSGTTFIASVADFHSREAVRLVAQRLRSLGVFRNLVESEGTKEVRPAERACREDTPSTSGEREPSREQKVIRVRPPCTRRVDIGANDPIAARHKDQSVSRRLLAFEVPGGSIDQRMTVPEGIL